MSFLIFIVSLAALLVALKALRDGQPRPGQPTPAERIQSLEDRVRDLLYRVWTLEQQAARGAPAALAPEATTAPEPTLAPEPMATPEPALVPPPVIEPAPDVVPAWSSAEAAAPATPPPGMPPAAGLNLEQRIGARWTTWVGAVAILFAAAFAVKLSIENNLIGPRARLGFGLVAGLVLLGAGLILRRRRDMPYLSEALAGLGLGLCYLSLFAGYAYYDLLQVGTAFALMFIVTVLGTSVAVATERQATAVLALLGGLLTPVLLARAEPNERGFLGYLVVLDLLIFAIARFRSWRGLNRLAWAGTVLLLAPVLTRQPEGASRGPSRAPLGALRALPPHAARARVAPGRAQ